MAESSERSTAGSRVELLRPSASRASTRKRWSPSASPEYVTGEPHATGLDPSSAQRNVAPASFASNVRVAVVWSVVPEGPEVIVT